MRWIVVYAYCDRTVHGSHEREHGQLRIGWRDAAVGDAFLDQRPETLLGLIPPEQQRSLLLRSP
jgi:hypothetical protein